MIGATYRKKFVRCFASIACLGMPVSSEAQSDRPLPPYAQRPDVSHPGTVKFIDLWNRTEKIESADDIPDGIKFFCMDEKRIKVERGQAAWCIPVVEYETYSVDANGKPVAPEIADFVRITSYGPRHTYIGSTVTPPNFRRMPH